MNLKPSLADAMLSIGLVTSAVSVGFLAGLWWGVLVAGVASFVLGWGRAAAE